MVQIISFSVQASKQPLEQNVQSQSNLICTLPLFSEVSSQALLFIFQSPNYPKLLPCSKQKYCHLDSQQLHTTFIIPQVMNECKVHLRECVLLDILFYFYVLFQSILTELEWDWLTQFVRKKEECKDL